MGWSSLNEDGWDRFYEDNMNRFRSEISIARHTIDSTEDAVTIRGISKAMLNQCENLLEEIKQHWHIATDPSLDLAHKILILEEENGKLLDTISGLQRENKRLRDQINERVGCGVQEI